MPTMAAVADGGMGVERILHDARHDLEATADDRVAGAPVDVEEAVVVE